jgi:CRP-like cAMP-binding protein
VASERRGGERIERVIALRAFPGFSGLATDNLAILAECVEERICQSGEVIARRGQRVPAVYFVRRGRVDVLRHGVTQRSVGSGGAAGGLAALTRDPDGQDIVAAEGTELFVVRIEEMEDYFEECFPAMLAALRNLAAGVIEARRRVPDDAGYPGDGGPLVQSVVDMDLVERIRFSRRLLAYGRGRIEALAELAREMKEVRLAAGTRLFTEGDAAGDAVLLVSGGVECVTAGGQRFVMGPDSMIGGLDSLAGETRWYSATALTEVVALRSDTSNLLDVMEDHPELGIGMARVLARALLTLLDQETPTRAPTW